MKSKIILFSVLGTIIVSLSNFTADRTSLFVMTMVNESPDLPSIPFNYSGIDIPEHLTKSDFSNDGQLGYESGGIDVSTFDAITDDKATLGRVLFYDARLSALENISCGTCHDQSLSFTENKDFSEGINALTKRNSMHLNDLGWSNNHSFAWDMRRQDLHEMIVLPLTDENEIGANMVEIVGKLSSIDYYPALFEQAYGSDEINEDKVVDALVQFIESMVTFNSRFDQEAARDFAGFTKAEMEGLELFASNCSSCHVQGNELDALLGGIPIEIEEPIFEFFPFIFNNGLPLDEDDAGTGEWTNIDDLFKLPTLRNIEMTAPYMHDGRFSSLEEVVEFYSEEVEANSWSFIIPDGGFKFNDDEKASLVAFLKTFTDESFLTEEKWSDPFQKGTSTQDITFENVKLSPNPMQSTAVVSFDNPGNRSVQVNILSASGQLIKQEIFSGGEYILNKQDFGRGMYFIQMTMGEMKSIQKLIVQ